MSEPEFVLVGCALAIIGALRAAWSPCGQSMLASLTPLGERSRGFSWRVTATAYAVGAVGGAALTGVALGALGSLLPGGTGWRATAMLIVLLVALVIDATPLRRRLPVTRGQVNEDWMARYRGWVYGFGFGARLGVGLTTLVACAAVYATFASELLAATPATGGLIGAVFGTVKALSLVPARAGHDQPSLVHLHRRLARLDSPVAGAVTACELLACVAVLGLVA
jgi:MFS family permease